MLGYVEIQNPTLQPYPFCCVSSGGDNFGALRQLAMNATLQTREIAENP
jgi:hypothetical protein